MNRVNKDFFMTFKAVGTLTHEDYKQITPLIDSALEGVKDAKIKAIADISELDGWELRAAWDDMKIGLKHGSEFEKIAIIGSQTWIEYSAKVSSWFMSSQIETFSNEKEALSWLNK
ncbi:MAG: STAS/SEC14 domain-containing protein [Helicobacteraceae bacterium]|nr:STAS/SEC14 domain-containing protein [Helicobacteraceae bacterium]